MYYYVISFKLTRQLFLLDLWKKHALNALLLLPMSVNLWEIRRMHTILFAFSFSSSINTKSKYCRILILCVFCRFASKAVAYAIEENTSCFFVYTSLLSMYKHRACKHIVISADGIDKNNLRIQYIHYMYIPFLIFFLHSENSN